MSRLPIIPPEQMNEAQRKIYEEILRTRGGVWFHGPYDPLLLQPRLAQPAQVMGEFVRFHTSLGPRLAEMTILIVARFWDCDFEWYQHEPIARDKDVPAQLIDELRKQLRPSQMQEDERVLYDFTQSLLRSHRVTDADYERARAIFGDVGMVELTGIIGYYTFLAFTLNGHAVALPAGAAAPFS